ncbi:MAG: hypothetical protein HYZ14_08815 [Bacteroidetes bacterium]|nr:hypothetical protein [Bacteroidota bacterium]
MNSGFNRVGLYADAGLELAIQSHQVHLGARYYGPDYVFESDVLGVSLGYTYSFSKNRWWFGPGVSGGFFHETKSASELFLSEFLLRNTLGYEFGKPFAVYSSIGLGAVMNTYQTVNTVSKSTSGYINYEFSIGIKYYWHTFSGR